MVACAPPPASETAPAPALPELPLGRLSVSHLEPGVGEEVRAWAAYAGPWPAALDWSGVDADQGIQARVQVQAPGPHRIAVDGAAVVLQVQEASPVGPSVARVETRPLPALAGACADPRFPALAGPWAVGCGTGGGGAVDLAVDLRTGQQVRLEGAVAAPGRGPGVLFAPGREAGAWTLPAPGPTAAAVTWTMAPVAPPATDGVHTALLLEDEVVLLGPDGRTAWRTEANPLPWYPPALAGSWVAWVDGRERALTGPDIWLWNVEERGRPVPLVRAPGRQRHVAGSGRFLGWVDEDGVWVEDLSSGERRSWPAETGFRAGLALWGPVACWEERTGGDLDVACSDGVVLRGAGDQGWPSRWGPWLLYRQDGVPWLATATLLVLDDDDLRAQGTAPRVAGGYREAHRAGPVRWTLDWPAPGWCQEVYVDGRWLPRGSVPTGDGVVLESPGDAVRLVRSAGSCPPP